MSFLCCWVSGIDSEPDFVRPASLAQAEVYASSSPRILLGRVPGELSTKSRDSKPALLPTRGSELDVAEQAHGGPSAAEEEAVEEEAVEQKALEKGPPNAPVDPGRTEEEHPVQQLQQQLISQLTSPERQALAALHKELGDEGIEAVRATLVPGEPLISCLLRFLRNQSFKPIPATKLLKAHAAWCQVERPAALADLSKEEVAGCPSELLDRYLPTWHQGFDRQGRPVIISHYGKFSFKPLLAAGVTVEKILQLHVRRCEHTARLCGEQTQKLGRDISNAVIIMDTAGLDSSVVRSKATFDWARGLANTDTEHYVERSGQVYIINAPSAVHMFFKACSWMLPEKAQNQVKIFSRREAWAPALLELIDASELPPEYGGTGAPLTFLQGH